MVKYGNGKIYKLVNSVDDEIYVGSTTSPLSKRKVDHKGKTKKFPDRKVYEHLNAIGWDHVDIVLIEDYPCANKEQLHARERYWIEQLKPSLNRYVPHRNPGEVYAVYREAHRAERYAKQAEVVECECGATTTRCGISRHKKTTLHARYMAGNLD